MRLKLRFTATGTVGAILFVGATLVTGISYLDMMRRALSPYASPSMSAQPWVYVALSTMGALGLAMMLSGRELVSSKLVDKEKDDRKRAAAAWQAASETPPKRRTMPVDPAKYRD